jgi:hypothetical protein
VASSQGYMTKVDWGAVKSVFKAKTEATNEILPRATDSFSLLGGPLEVEGNVRPEPSDRLQQQNRTRSAVCRGFQSMSSTLLLIAQFDMTAGV